MGEQPGPPVLRLSIDVGVARGKTTGLLGPHVDDPTLQAAGSVLRVAGSEEVGGFEPASGFPGVGPEWGDSLGGQLGPGCGGEEHGRGEMWP